MKRLLIVFLILQCAAAASEDPEGNPSGDFEDDEDLSVERSNSISNADLQSFGTDESKGGENDDKADGTLIIIIAATSVIALAVVAIVATVLFRHYCKPENRGFTPCQQSKDRKLLSNHHGCLISSLRWIFVETYWKHVFSHPKNM